MARCKIIQNQHFVHETNTMLPICICLTIEIWY